MCKRILVVISAILLTVCLFFANNTPLFKGYANNCEIYLDDCSNTKAIINLKNDKYPFIFNKKGESVCIEKQTFDLHTFLLEMRASVIFSEIVDGKTSYYAYSPKIKYMQKVKNRNINLHVVIGENSVKVGSPVIYGSF